MSLNSEWDATVPMPKLLADSWSYESHFAPATYDHRQSELCAPIAAAREILDRAQIGRHPFFDYAGQLPAALKVWAAQECVITNHFSQVLLLKAQYFSRIANCDINAGDSLSLQVEQATRSRAEVKARLLARAQDLTGGRSLGGPFLEWQALDFATFRTELAKRYRADIPVAERDQWEAYFDARKAEVSALEARICDIEAEINDRVCRAFSLTSDETALIDEGNAGQY